MLCLLGVVGGYIMLIEKENIIYEVSIPCTDDSDDSCTIETSPQKFRFCESQGTMTQECLIL